MSKPQGAEPAGESSPPLARNAGGGDDDRDELQEQARAALLRGVAFLMLEQSRDGGWHSETYGAMHCGASLTSLVLYAMSHVPEPMQQDNIRALRGGYDFLQRGLGKKQFIACPDGTLDYPLYSSAMTLRAMHRIALGKGTAQFGDRDSDPAMLLRFILAEQRDQTHDFEPESLEYGGGGFLGGAGRLDGRTDGTQISVTSFALEALALAERDDAAVQEARQKALKWLSRLQHEDGGFHFHAAPAHPGNKARWKDDASRSQPRAYGTATCDGLRALLYAGVKVDDPRFERGVKWLEQHAQIEAVPGFAESPPESPWDRGLRYYYYFSLSKLWPHLPDRWDRALRRDLLVALVEDQQQDGRWQNPSSAMREDDPLIATPLAIIALAETLEHPAQGQPAKQP